MTEENGLSLNVSVHSSTWTLSNGSQGLVQDGSPSGSVIMNQYFVNNWPLDYRFITFCRSLWTHTDIRRFCADCNCSVELRNRFMPVGLQSI